MTSQHDHQVPAVDDRHSHAIALGVISVVFVVEVAAGILASSLALLSDAAYMLTYAASIALALVGNGHAARPASARVSGVSLLVLSGIVAVEAVRRLAEPQDVDGGIVIVVGVVGVVAVVGAARARAQSAQSAQRSVEGTMAHIYGCVAVVAAGVAVLVGVHRADAIAALRSPR